MHQRTCRPIRPDDGGSAVEYGILISAIALVIVGVVTVFGGLVSNLYANVF